MPPTCPVPKTPNIVLNLPNTHLLGSCLSSRICLLTQGIGVQSLVGELRSHMVQLSAHTATLPQQSIQCWESFLLESSTDKVKHQKAQRGGKLKGWDREDSAAADTRGLQGPDLTWCLCSIISLHHRHPGCCLTVGYTQGNSSTNSQQSGDNLLTRKPFHQMNSWELAKGQAKNGIAVMTTVESRFLPAIKSLV